MSRELSKFEHEPVLLDECLEGLAIKPDGTYVDCTAGGAGHSSAILRALGPDGLLIAFDRDTDALETAEKVLTETAKANDGRNFRLIHASFAHLKDGLEDVNVSAVAGILADLGVSSWQLDEASRGFAYMKDGPLDMRMDTSQGETAADLVNRLSEQALKDILLRYGEERYAGRIARRIVERRAEQAFLRTLDLSDVIRAALPAKARHEDQHPAKRSFQALRIAVNDELGELESMLEQAVGILETGGRLAIISFHSLEDRIVKEAYRLWEDPCICPRNLPVCVCGRKPLGKAIGRKGVSATAEELERNPRSRSARLRVFERNEETYRHYSRT